ncbi:MAG: ATP-binding protein [Acidobacteriota bacterium]
MKITTRIVFGYSLFIAVLIGLAVYQVMVVIRMQDITESLKDINSPNALNSLQAIQDVELIRDSTERSLIKADPAYIEQLKGFLVSFKDETLADFESPYNSDEESEAIGQLKQSFDKFTFDLGEVLANFPEAGLDDVPQIIKTDLQNLRVRADLVYDAVKQTMSTKLDESTQTSRTAQFVLISITVVILSITIIISLLIVRSISKPLVNLTEGTRAITEGKYFYRLDTSRNDEFAQLAKDFNTMIRRLDELDELKKDFISHVSHELKAPLASMRETVLLLIDEIPGPLTDKQKRLLELNLQSAERLTAMIRNLLDLSKIEAGTMDYTLKRHNLVPLVQTAISAFDVRAQEKRVRIETDLPDTPLEATCDSDRIVQVLINLVGNAVKFSPPRGIVRIALESVKDLPKRMPEMWRSTIVAADKHAYFALVSIADSGPGIADHDKLKIFEKFHQVQKGKKIEGQGVGLGLAICRTIVQVHGGAIWVEDDPGGGSRFFLLLGSGSEEEVAVRESQPI